MRRLPAWRPGLDASEDRTAERASAVGKRFLLDTERSQNAKVDVRHLRLSLSPVSAMLQAQVGSARDQSWQVLGVMCCTRPASELHDRVVEQAAVPVLIAVQALQ